MKQFFATLTFALISTCLVLAGCAAPAAGGKAQTPQEIAAAVCPQVQGTLTALGALALEPKAMADLEIAGKAVGVVCGAGAVVEFASLQTMANSSLPMILGAIKDAGLEAAEQNRLVLNVTAANLILNGAIQSAQAAGLPTK